MTDSVYTYLFFSPSCGHCQRILKLIASKGGLEHTGIELKNVNNERVLAERMNIDSVPTIVFGNGNNRPIRLNGKQAFDWVDSKHINTVAEMAALTTESRCHIL